MREFCKQLLEFLQSEYGDGYDFQCDVFNDVTCGEDAQLEINFSSSYRVIVGRNSMKYLFGLWKSNRYVEERNQYLWQKELIDIIEGS